MNAFPSSSGMQIRFVNLTEDAKLARQSGRALAVNRREVDRLGLRAHFRSNLVLRHAEDDRRGLAMNVAAPLERFDERPVT